MALLATVIRRSMKALPPSDLPAATLALSYARQIDEDGERIDALGPKLLAVLESLLMTPRARAAMAKAGGTGDKRANPLDELRARRAARVHDSAAMDSPAP